MRASHRQPTLIPGSAGTARGQRPGTAAIQVPEGCPLTGNRKEPDSDFGSFRERKRRMRWFKVAAIAAGVLIAYLVISSVIGLLIEAAIAALVVAVIVLAIKVAVYRKQISWKMPRQRDPRAQIQQSAAPSQPPRCRRRTGPAEARDGRLAVPSYRQSARASLLTAVVVASMRIRAAVVRPAPKAAGCSLRLCQSSEGAALTRTQILQI